MSVNGNTIHLTDIEEDDFGRMIDHKIMWRDLNVKTISNLCNGIFIDPIQALSGYHLWMRRNLVFLTGGEEVAYISGCCLIIEHLTTKLQTMIQLSTQGNCTSLSFQVSSTGERLVIIGEKTNQGELVEIINLDKKILQARTVLEHSYYLSSETQHSIDDAVIPNSSNLCISIVKKEDMHDHSTQVFIWDYVNVSLVSIEIIANRVESIVVHPVISTKLLLFSPDYLAEWNYSNGKKKIILANACEISQNGEEIMDAMYINISKFQGIGVAFKSHQLKIYTNQFHDLFLCVNLLDIVTENVYKKSDDTCHIFKPQKSQIKYIIARDKYLFVFLTENTMYFVFEFIDVANTTNINDASSSGMTLTLNSIGFLHSKLNKNSSVIFNSSMSRGFIINCEPVAELKNVIKKAVTLDFLKNKNIDTEKSKNRRKSDLVKILYDQYKIAHNDHNSPSLIFETNFKEASCLGYEIKTMCLSINPRLLLVSCGYLGCKILIYKQSDIFDNNNLSTSVKDDCESDQSTLMHTTTQFLKQQTSLTLSHITSLYNPPISISISPFGESFFVTFKECGTLYTILNKDIKETLKVNAFCMSSAFSESGCYLAVATSEVEIDYYNINIINVNTGEVEYVISKLPPPVKIAFVDNDRKICALFNDNTTNLLGWELRNDIRHMKYKVTLVKAGIEKEKDEALILKITDFIGVVKDFLYDHVMKYCLLLSDDNRMAVYNTSKVDSFWELKLDCKYTVCLLVKKFDCVFIGTSLGSVRSYLWPISNLNPDTPPCYFEKFLHSNKITSLVISNDLRFLYSSASDGSVFVSCVHATFEDTPIGLSTLNSFNPKNILPKVTYMQFSDFTPLTEALYGNKTEAVEKKKFEIQSSINEFNTEKEKLLTNNFREIEIKKSEMADILEKKMKKVKDTENEKDSHLKILKEKRMTDVARLDEEFKEIKAEYHTKKENKQKETKFFIELTKNSKLHFSEMFSKTERDRCECNSQIASSLQKMLGILITKKTEIEECLKLKTDNFYKNINQFEDNYESKLKQSEHCLRNQEQFHEMQKKEYQNEIMKTNKDNKNHDNKIKELEKHLQDIKRNNQELMESFLLSSVKLNQMSQALCDNEDKITEREKYVQQRRHVNDRLDDLKYVLEYQIDNLMKEKTPIEEQIKNFESLYSDFYKRFSVLHEELLIISKSIQSNKELIEDFKKVLVDSKNTVFNLKNIYMSIDVDITTILTNKGNDKNSILNGLVEIYNKYLKDLDYSLEEAAAALENTQHAMAIRTEGKAQKTKVISDLTCQRRRKNHLEMKKREMMMDIRLENQNLIEDCSNIRTNLEEILKFITDIEKKFIELTNMHHFIKRQQTTKSIRDDIRNAKNSILLPQSNKAKIAKGNSSGYIETTATTQESERVPGKNKAGNKRYSELDNSNSNGNSTILPTISSSGPDYLVRTLEHARGESNMQIQLEKIQKKAREILLIEGDRCALYNSNADIRPSKLNINIQALNSQDKKMKEIEIASYARKHNTRLSMDNLNNSRKITIKAKKFYDSQIGGIRELSSLEK